VLGSATTGTTLSRVPSAPDKHSCTNTSHRSATREFDRQRRYGLRRWP
jgi:hypothetical protein